MKKITYFIVGLLLLTTALPSNAQMRIGVLGGLNVASLDMNTSNKVPQFDRTMFGAGCVLEVEMNNHLSIVAEPMLIKKGGGAIEGAAIYHFNRYYLEAPLMLKLKLASKISPYVMGGASFGYLLSSNLGGSYKADTIDGDFSPLTKKFDFGFTFGAGISYQLRTYTIFLASRYTLGMINTARAGTVNVDVGDEVIEASLSEDKECKTRGIQVMAGVTFPISKLN